MGYVHGAKSFTPLGWTILFTTILLGLLVESLLRSESNLQSTVAAVFSVAILAGGLHLTLNFGQNHHPHSRR
jgi:hypothetical protein